MTGTATPRGGTPRATAAAASNLAARDTPVAVAKSAAKGPKVVALAVTASAAASAAAPAVDLRCLDGVRVLSSLGVVLYHCWMFVWLHMLPPELSTAYNRHNWFVRLAIVAGPLGVEFYLVVSALLAAYQLVPQMEGSSGGGPKAPAGPSCLSVVLRYWRRRAARILPAFLVSLAPVAAALPPPDLEALPPAASLTRLMGFGGCPAQLWRNLLFVSNWNVAENTCCMHLWSLSVQVQFYLAFPLLLWALRPRAAGFHARLTAALAAVVAAGFAYRLLVAGIAAPYFSLPAGSFMSSASNVLETEDWRTFVALQTALYCPTGPRLPSLATGALLGLALRSKGPYGMHALLRRRTLVTLAALASQAAFVYTVVLAWPMWGALPGDAQWGPLATQLYAAVVFWGGLPSVAAALTVLAMLLRSDPLHSAAASVLAARRLRPLAALSYCVYLLEQQARLWVLAYLVPAGWLPALLAAAPLPGLLLTFALSLAAVLPLAAATHVLVERRF